MPLEDTSQCLLFYAKVVCPAGRQAVALERPDIVQARAFLRDRASIIGTVAKHAHVRIVVQDGPGSWHDADCPHRAVGLKRSKCQVSGGQYENCSKPVAKPAHTYSCGLHSIRFFLGSSPDGSQGFAPVLFGLPCPLRRGSRRFVNTIYIVLLRNSITVNTYSL